MATQQTALTMTCAPVITDERGEPRATSLANLVGRLLAFWAEGFSLIPGDVDSSVIARRGRGLQYDDLLLGHRRSH